MQEDPQRRSRDHGRMDFLYSLYDALLGINVPADKARAVVDAMERDMGTTLATKADLRLLEQRIISLENRFGAFEEKLEARLAAKPDSTLVQKELELLRASMTVRLGSIQVVTAGLLFAALRLT
jgi:hypothetical protein